MTLDKCIVLRIGTLTGCPLCRESHPLCRLKNPTVISIWLLVGFHPATRSVQSTPADNTRKRVWQYIEKERKVIKLISRNQLFISKSAYKTVFFWDKCIISFFLSLEDSECDLGILFKKNLKFDEHIDKVVNKVNRISGLIRRKFTHIDKSTFLTLYKSLVRSHLDYGNLIYYPTTKKCKQILENAQRRATRLVPELRGMFYEERLMELNLSTLEYRRRRYDIIQVFKIIHKIDDIDMSKFFTFTDNCQLRGHNLKLNKPRVNKSIRLNSFAMRTIPVWNNLPSEIVNSKTVLEFKTKIDKLWKNARYDLSEIY